MSAGNIMSGVFMDHLHVKIGRVGCTPRSEFGEDRPEKLGQLLGKLVNLVFTTLLTKIRPRRHSGSASMNAFRCADELVHGRDESLVVLADDLSQQ